MIGHIVVFLVNCARWVGNRWRRLLRRRVDYVRITISGRLPQFVAQPPWWQRRLLGRGAPLSMHRLRQRFARIAADPQVRGVILRIEDVTAGWATLQALHSELHQLRAAGKRVVAYVLTLNTPAYYAACAADEIIAPPLARFSVLGLRVEVQFLKDALAKIGLTAEVEAVSPYKSLGEQLVRSEFSPENREQLERLLDNRYAELLRAIAEGRSKPVEDVRAAIDTAPLSARQACERGLIDALLYEDQLAEHLQAGERPPVIRDWRAARRAVRLPYVRRYPRRVAVVPVEGVLAAGESRDMPLPLPLIGGRTAGANSIGQALRVVERNRRIAALILYINSRGGDAFASDLIWREVQRVARRKPVVVVMGDVAASGGYYIAAPAKTIIAQPGTLTGSIGVVSIRITAAPLLEQVGVNTIALSRGENSGLLSASRALTERERLIWRDQIVQSYDAFKQRVRDGRGFSDAQLEPLAGGRVWSGAEAQQHGLIDQLGGIGEALARAQELADLPRDPAMPLLVIGGRRGNLAPQPFPSGSFDLLALLDTIEAALQPRIWAIMPFEASGLYGVVPCHDHKGAAL